MTDSPKCVSKQQLHFMALLIAITLETVKLTTFWTVISWSIRASASCASLHHDLKNPAEQRMYSVDRSCSNIKSNSNSSTGLYKWLNKPAISSRNTLKCAIKIQQWWFIWTVLCVCLYCTCSDASYKIVDNNKENKQSTIIHPHN